MFIMILLACLGMAFMGWNAFYHCVWGKTDKATRKFLGEWYGGFIVGLLFTLMSITILTLIPKLLNGDLP